MENGTGREIDAETPSKLRISPRAEEHRVVSCVRKLTSKEITNCVAQVSVVYYVAAMNETLTVMLGQELARALREEARQSGLPRGEIARQALEARLRHSTKLRTMRRYFGILSGPADLSSNKIYRRSWGKNR